MQPTPGRVAAELRHGGKSQPVTGQIRIPAPTEPITFYTDGSVSQKRITVGSRRDRIGWMTGWGYLATDGRYGCGQLPQFDSKVGKDPAVVTELRAIWHAVGHLLPTQHVIVITDSMHAANILTTWQTGTDRMPTGYTGSTRPGKLPTLEKLRQTVATNPNNLTIDNVKGHAGDVLNEAADTLAMLGMRWGRDRLHRHDIERRADNIAEGFLSDWRNR